MHIIVQVISYFIISIILIELILVIIILWRSDIDVNNTNIPEVSNVTTSVVGMLPLLKMERILMQNLEDYAKALHEKEAIIRSALAQLHLEHNKYALNTEYYLSIPTNSLAFSRRIYEDWPRWLSYMQQQVGAAQVRVLEAHLPNLPKRDYFEAAIDALERIQSTYELKPNDLTTGLINGKQYDAQLTALDCYSIGEALYQRASYAAAANWLHVALQLFVAGPLNVAMNFTRSAVEMLYERAMALHSVPTALTSDIILRNRGCRGEYATETRSQFYCRYNRTTTPFLKLAPFKMEIIQLDPYMVLFHDVLSEREIAELQAYTRDHLKRATVVGKSAQDRRLSKQRTSQLAKLADDASETVARINRRIGHMTGFDISHAEIIQVQNYGLGGHYAPHFDYFDKLAEHDRGGDRIATVLFYMNDVEQGGATIFPQIPAAIFPKRGTALLWYNLDNRGVGDKRTLHGGCPILVGSKWIFTKWIREQDQMFRRPCYKETN